MLGHARQAGQSPAVELALRGPAGSLRPGRPEVGSNEGSACACAASRLFLAVHRFMGFDAPVAASDGDVLRGAEYAAFTGALQLRSAMFGKHPCAMKRGRWTHDDLAGESRPGNKDKRSGRY
jgi:hypothetical protein